MVNYNLIAPYYDFLANLVFGNTLIRAQQKFLESIEPNSSILILGGGSGQILTDIDNIVKGCTINFIEISTGMMELARNRKVINNTIVFDQHLEPSTRTYDIIIMNFFLDQFTESYINKHISAVFKVATPQTKWLISDFVAPKSKQQKILMRLMYLFFRLTCSIDAARLPPWQDILLTNGLIVQKEHFFCNDFVVSLVLSES